MKTLVVKAKEIARKINSFLPNVNVFLEYYNNDKNHAYILIDSEEAFESKEYAKFIIDIQDEIEEYDIDFSCLNLMIKLSDNAINLTKENLEEEKNLAKIKYTNIYTISKINKFIIPNRILMPFNISIKKEDFDNEYQDRYEYSLKNFVLSNKGVSLCQPTAA